MSSSSSIREYPPLDGRDLPGELPAGLGVGYFGNDDRRFD